MLSSYGTFFMHNQENICIPVIVRIIEKLLLGHLTIEGYGVKLELIHAVMLICTVKMNHTLLTAYQGIYHHKLSL